MGAGRHAALLLALALGAAGCTGAASGRPNASRIPIRPGVEVAPPPGAATQPAQLLIRRASLGLEVAAPARALDAVARLATRAGGYVQGTTLRDDHASLVLRIPAPAFDATLDSIARLGRVTHRDLHSDDVTQHVADTDARIANLRALRDRLRQLLERATTVADVVTVERELARVQTELDMLESRVRTMRSMVAMSELRVDLRRRPGRLGWLLAGAALIAALVVSASSE